MFEQEKQESGLGEVRGRSGFSRAGVGKPMVVRARSATVYRHPGPSSDWWKARSAVRGTWTVNRGEVTQGPKCGPGTKTVNRAQLTQEPRCGPGTWMSNRGEVT